MILLSAYSRLAPESDRNPKDYPYWPEVIDVLSKDHKIVQVGLLTETRLVEDMRYDLSLPKLAQLINECKTWISVDSFFQHYAWSLGKRGVVVFSKSDPNIFGHKENINLLKSRDYLRPDQFGLWKDCPYDEQAFIEPQKVIDAVKSLL